MFSDWSTEMIKQKNNEKNMLNENKSIFRIEWDIINSNDKNETNQIFFVDIFLQFFFFSFAGF